MPSGSAAHSSIGSGQHAGGATALRRAISKPPGQPGYPSGLHDCAALASLQLWLAVRHRGDGSAAAVLPARLSRPLSCRSPPPPRQRLHVALCGGALQQILPAAPQRGIDHGRATDSEGALGIMARLPAAAAALTAPAAKAKQQADTARRPSRQLLPADSLPRVGPTKGRKGPWSRRQFRPRRGASPPWSAPPPEYSAASSASAAAC